MAPFVRATHITVRPDRLVCDIRLSPECPRTSSPVLIETLQRDHPLLSQHACKNGVGPTFGAVMEKTALIHVIEHLAIDCLVQENPCSEALYVGTSQWVDKMEGTGRVELSYRDDVAALAALKRAIDQLNDALKLALG